MRLKLYRGKWAAVWSDEAGRTQRRSLRTADRGVAQRRLADLERQPVTNGTVADAFAAYCADLEERGKSAERARNAWKRLEYKFGALRPDQVTKLVCRQYVRDRRKAGVSDGTIRTELGRLSTALNSVGKHNPAEVELPPEPDARTRYLTRDEFNRLRDAAASDHIRLFIVLAGATGARKGAILQLTWDRIDFAAGRIDFGKRVGNKGRGVKPMTRAARAELEKARAGWSCTHVIEYAGKPVRAIDMAFRRTVERAGLEPCGPHDIRRSVGRWLAEDGIDISIIAQLLDHTDIRVTIKHYSRFSPRFMAEAIGSLEA